MDPDSDISSGALPRPFRKAGFWAVLLGAIAVVLVFVQMVGPTLEPKPSAATQIGEIAGEIKRSAWLSFLGISEPEPELETASLWSYLALVAPILGVVALVLSLVSGLKRENWRYPVYGASLGVAAIVFQYLWWVVILVAGVLLLIAIIENMGDIFSF